MHVEKRREGKKTKYYLAHAFRMWGKGKKIRVYLGTDTKAARKNRPSAEQIIKERIKAYEVISDPFQHMLNTAEIENIKNLGAKGDIKVRHLNEDDWKMFVAAL